MIDCRLELLVYDNSPTAQSIEEFKFLRIIYQHDPSNPGVAAAYNNGARIARESGKKWLLLLDQDTLFPVDTIEMYCASLANSKGFHMFAPRLVAKGLLFSPFGYWGGIGYHLRNVIPGLMSLKRRGVLNSGMLVSCEAFDGVGGFDERIPLDFADHDFSRRFAEQFGEAFIVNLDCEHGFSDREEATLESALARYAFFCYGARQSIKSFSDSITYAIAVIKRCLVLSVRYRTMRFVPVMIQKFLQ
jgi:glycosyltransferase involved in cell wall biosynthesis